MTGRTRPVYPAASVRMAAVRSNSRSSSRIASPARRLQFRIARQQHGGVAMGHVQQMLVFDRVGQPVAGQAGLARAQVRRRRRAGENPRRR